MIVEWFIVGTQVSEARRARTQGRGGTRAHGRGSVGNWPRASAGNWVAKAAKPRLSGTAKPRTKQSRNKGEGKRGLVLVLWKHFGRCFASALQYLGSRNLFMPNFYRNNLHWNALINIPGCLF